MSPTNVVERLRDWAIRTMTMRGFGKGTAAFKRDTTRGQARAAAAPVRTDGARGPHLVLTSGAFDFQSPSPPPQLVYGGAALDDPAWTEPWVSPWSADDTRPRDRPRLARIARRARPRRAHEKRKSVVGCPAQEARHAATACNRTVGITTGTVICGSVALGQPAQAGRPPLLFKEEWRSPKHDGPATDENTRFKPEVVTNERVEARVYGPDAQVVRAAEHEARVDLWNGLAGSPVAVTLRDKRNYVDLTGLARLRWIVRTNAIHTLYPVVKVADGTLLAGDRAITTNGEFVQVEIAFTGMRWYNSIRRSWSSCRR